MIVNELNSHIVILRKWTHCKRQEKALAMTNPIPLRRVHTVNGSRSDIRDHQLAREKEGHKAFSVCFRFDCAR